MLHRPYERGRAGRDGRGKMPPADQGRAPFPLPEVRYYKTPEL